ncbi:unnamed protein product, partial [Heterosigma akashiwo]
AATAAAAAPGGAQQFLDPAFVNSLLGSLPGVDPSDPKIQAALQQIGGSDAKQEDKDKKDDDKKES